MGITSAIAPDNKEARTNRRGNGRIASLALSRHGAQEASRTTKGDYEGRRERGGGAAESEGLWLECEQFKAISRVFRESRK